MICGEKTTSQHAIEIELFQGREKNVRNCMFLGGDDGRYPMIPLMASMSSRTLRVVGNMILASECNVNCVIG